MQLLKKTIIIVRDPYTHIAIGRETSAGKLKFRICQFAKFTDMMVTSRKPITIQAFFTSTVQFTISRNAASIQNALKCDNCGLGVNKINISKCFV